MNDNLLLKDRRIFVVEDDAFNLGIILAMLKQNGAEVAYDGWGWHTLDRMEAFLPIDIILLDIVLPKITGFEVADLIRRQAAFQDIKIAAVTASDPAVNMKKAREENFIGFISKPLNMSVFPRMVAAMIDGQPVWGEL